MQIFARPRPRSLRETAVPMINIVFLLLIFFLMAAQIAPPDPFEIAAPEADSPLPPEAGGDPAALYLAADGRLAFGAARDEGVWSALAALDETALMLRADAAVPGADLAAVLARLSELGVARVTLITQAGG